MLGFRLRKFFWTTILLLLLYFVVFGCRSATPSLNAVVQVACAHLNRLVYPLWDTLTPKVAAFDERIGLSKSVAPYVDVAVEKVRLVDQSYHLSEYTVKAAHSVHVAATRSMKFVVKVQKSVSAFYFYKLHPSVCYYGDKYKLALEYAVEKVWTVTRSQTLYAARKFHIWSRYFYYTRVAPFISWVVDSISENEHFILVCKKLHLDWAASELARLFHKLKLKSVVINTAIQEKTEFLRGEFGALHKFNDFRKSFQLNTKKNFQMVMDLTQDLAGVHKKPTSEEIVVEEESLGESSDEEDVTVTLTKTLTEFKTLQMTSSATSQETLVSSPAPLQMTSSVRSQETLVSSSAPSAVNLTDANISVAGDDIVSFDNDIQGQVNYELNHWEDKINSTLELAEASLVADFAPYLQRRISEIKEAFSANFTNLQTDNYLRYKVMNELIAAIDKDSEYIRTHQTIIAEPKVDRQIMRDKIQEARDIVEEQMDIADAELSKAHTEILTAYFEVAQNTVDVLESFAETTILDFSNRLKIVIDFVSQKPGYDDKISWSAWKKFHQIKESIFQIRDKIFDEAIAYKENPQAQQKPKALLEWDEYLRNINFHIGFLARDNDEYLRLVRAQANVAYQQREGLTYELEEAQKKAEEDALLAQQLAEEQAQLKKKNAEQAELEKKIAEQAKSAQQKSAEQARLAQQIAKEQYEQNNQSESNVNVSEATQVGEDLTTISSPTSSQSIISDEVTTIATVPAPSDSIVGNETHAESPALLRSVEFSLTTTNLSVSDSESAQSTTAQESTFLAESSSVLNSTTKTKSTISTSSTIASNSSAHTESQIPTSHKEDNDLNLEKVYEPSELDEDYESEDLEA